MKTKSKLCIALFAGALLSSCSKDSGEMPVFPGGNTEVTPVEDKPVMLWVDASANFSRFVSQDSISKYVMMAKECGFTHLIVDVRPTSGEVMYKGSAYADEIVTWKGVTRDNSWDYLSFFIQEARKNNLKIYAAMNTMTGGQNIMRRGPVYTNPEIAKLTTQLYTSTGMVDGKDDSRGAVFLNPCDSRTQDYVLNIAKEIVAKYDIDGLMYDRCRYDNETADFSDVSKAAFEQYLKDTYGRSGVKFPSDIFSYDSNEKIVYGEYRKIWYEWRASVIHDFFYKSRTEIKKIKPDVDFATYTGGWYSSYYQEGSNWASNTYDPVNEFPVWANSNYKKTGFAEALDYHLAGFYYATIEGSGWWTISGGISNVKRINRGACPVISSLAPEEFRNNRSNLNKAVQVSMKNADGMMIFDFYHVREYNFWNEIKSGIQSAIDNQ